MSDQAELIPIAEAAARLGLHKNTVHKRVDDGWYRWEWMPGKRGRQKGIHAADLHNTGPREPADDAAPSVHMDPYGSIQASTDPPPNVQSVQMDPSGRMDASPEPRPIDADAIARAAGAALAPYLDRLAAISEENGRLKEQVRALEARLLERQESPGASLPADMSPHPERPPWWRRFLGLD